jgi:hypothetical protein
MAKTLSNTPVAAQLSLPILRYPRTPHLEGSRQQAGDAPDVQPLAPLAGHHAVIEEKMDGANCAISFTEGGELCLQSRGHYLLGGARERQFSALHPWARAHEAGLLACLQDRYVLYGEWMFAKHAVFYDRLPHYLLEFDVWDRMEQCFLSTSRRHALLAGLPVVSVPVLYEGPMPQRADWLWSLVGHSLARTPHWSEALDATIERLALPHALCRQQSDPSPLAEGLYVKLEDEHQVLARFKLVRADFVQHILDSGSHHSERPIVPNGLAPGVDLYAPQLRCNWADLGAQCLYGLEALQAHHANDAARVVRRARKGGAPWRR